MLRPEGTWIGDGWDNRDTVEMCSSFDAA